MKRTLALFLTMCLALTLFAGCGSAQTNSNETPDDRSVTVTDMSGDSVTIEGEVKSIINLWPAGTSSFFVMGAGDLVKGLAVNSTGTMSAWTQYFYPESVNIPALGGTTPSVEELINLEPDLVIIHPSTAKDGFAEQIRKAGIPAININFSDYESMIEAYTILGKVLGGDYEKKLATWCEEVETKLAKSRELTKDIPEDEKPVVYYIAGQGESLVTTMAQNSIMQDWVESNGGIYAAKALNLDSTEVTAEQIFQLDPDVIIVGGAYQHVLVDQLKNTDGWKDLKAVKNNRVYTNPYACFNWDRFGLESNLQIEYALMAIQPEIAAENGIDREYMVKRIIEFYKQYNGKELTAEEAGYMLDGLKPDGTAEIPVQ
ncbi:ABC transporter substrate-binding protein [Christensenella sp. MSJ-20]|uniref:ABC transporter substrate-binding protein n=1 Tax=Christensenella sp. MSJ-20 TaxID=2841518 RepID=UPI001C76CB1C|nr:ABC transporter substrate-binding protein [Christensenella sp. MSJ-20]